MDSTKLEKFKKGKYVSVRTNFGKFDARIEEIYLPTETSGASLLLRNIETNNIGEYTLEDIVEMKKHFLKPRGALIA